MRSTPRPTSENDDYEAQVRDALAAQRRYGDAMGVAAILNEEADDSLWVYEHAEPDRRLFTDLMCARVALLRRQLERGTGTPPTDARTASTFGYTLNSDGPTSERELCVEKDGIRIRFEAGAPLMSEDLLPGSSRFVTCEVTERTRRGAARRAWFQDGTWALVCRDPRIQRAIDHAVAVFG